MKFKIYRLVKDFFFKRVREKGVFICRGVNFLGDRKRIMR